MTGEWPPCAKEYTLLLTVASFIKKVGGGNFVAGVCKFGIEEIVVALLRISFLPKSV